MIGKIRVTSRYPFALNDTHPKRLFVRCVSSPEDATPIYAIIADHGWAERILCTGCTRDDANDIAETLGEALLAPAELAPPIHD
jgi:hypothetical protein